jgi:hypothetical protein
MDPNHDTISNMKLKHLINGAVIGLLAGMVVGSVSYILLFTVFTDDPLTDYVALIPFLIFGAQPGAIPGLLGGLIGGLIYLKLGGGKKALVLSAILGVIGGLIAVIICFVCFGLMAVWSNSIT